jgi:zinc protease
VASSLDEWIAVADWTLYARYADKVAKVTPADVKRVAQKYLAHEQSTTGWFVPVVGK